MGLIKYVGAFIMTALFSFALIMFAIGFANDNDSFVNLASDSGYMNLTSNTATDVDTLYIQSNISATDMQEATISSQTEATEGGTSYKVGPWNAYSMAKRTLDISFDKIFGGNAAFGIFLTALIAMLVFIITWYIGKAWKGQPD